MREEVTHTITAVTDAAGLIATATNNTPLGFVSTGASIANDHSPMNVTTNVLGLVPGFGPGMATTGALNDLIDYGAHNNQPLDNWQTRSGGEPDTGDGSSGDSNTGGSSGGSQEGGSSGGTPEACQLTSQC